MFTFEAWDRTIEKIQEKFDFQKISQLFIFGDGALKTKENMYYFWKLANQHHKIVDLDLILAILKSMLTSEMAKGNFA